MSIYTPCSICLALALVHVRFQGEAVPKVTEALRAPFWHFWHPVGYSLEKSHALLSPTHHTRDSFVIRLVCTSRSSLRQ